MIARCPRDRASLAAPTRGCGSGSRVRVRSRSPQRACATPDDETDSIWLDVEGGGDVELPGYRSDDAEVEASRLRALIVGEYDGAWDEEWEGRGSRASSLASSGRSKSSFEEEREIPRRARPRRSRMLSAMSTELEDGRRPFLTAEWRNLCLFTYAVEPAMLEARLPPGLALDMRDGNAFVSLVAFDFLNTAVLGARWPGYRDFPEINLRFYVREGEKRGVAFVRELVPKRMIATIARRLYNEPYYYAPMTSRVSRSDERITVEHEVAWRGSTQRISLEAAPTSHVPGPSSTEHFFKEHSWGYGRSRANELVRYEVRHPVWAVHPVERWTLDWDFGAVYGEEWSALNSATPSSVVFAAGSAIAVSPVL